MKIDNCKLKINNKAFSLIELLIYVSIFAVVAGLMTSILTTVLKVNQRESASVETSEQLSFVMQTVSRLVRESSNIEIATSSASSALKLKLRMKDSAKDPTCFYLENQAIKLAEGPDAINPQNCNLNASSSLTSSKVIADKLDFSKISNYPGHDVVSIDIQLIYNSQNPESQITRNLKSAIARVSAATFDSNLLPGSDNQYEIGFSGNNRWKNIYLSGGINDSIYFSGGNVGIGLITPTSKFYVQSTSGTTTPAGRFEAATPGFIGTSLLADNTLGDSSAYNLFSARTDSDADLGGPFTKFVIRGDGNVGIGTTAPDTKLRVSGGSVAIDNSGVGWGTGYWVRNAANTDFVNMVALDNGNNMLVGSAGVTGNMSFSVGGEKMRILQNGYVGIGTASPANKLDVVVGQGMESKISVGPITQAEGSTQINAGTYNLGRSYFSSGWDDNFEISTFDNTPNGNWTIGLGDGAGGWDGTKYMHMSNSGNVGIGTTAPQGVLHVKGDLQLENVGVRCQILTQATICAPTWTQLGLNNTRYLCMQCW